jgi:hypothetical protein
MYTSKPSASEDRGADSVCHGLASTKVMCITGAVTIVTSTAMGLGVHVIANVPLPRLLRLTVGCSEQY